jgi:large subunit ribosomal protein L30
MSTKKDSTAKAARTNGKTVRVTLVKSVHGQLDRHRATARGLGLRRMHQTVTVNVTPEVRGMLDASRHLFRVEEA